MNSKNYIPLMNRFSDEKFKEIILNSDSYREAMRKMSYQAFSGDSIFFQKFALPKVAIEKEEKQLRCYQNLSQEKN